MILKHFDYYTEKLGWRVVPLFPNTKKPYFKHWNLYYNQKKTREFLERRPSSNIGLLLGDVIDIEGDDEKANERLKYIIGDYPHTCYKSGKSIHHLFINPWKTLTRISYNGIEFRGHRHQSVLPPSTVANSNYQWLKSSAFPLTSLPDSLISLYKELIDSAKTEEKSAISPWCSLCNNQVVVSRRKYNKDMTMFKKLGMKWICKKCR